MYTTLYIYIIAGESINMLSDHADFILGLVTGMCGATVLLMIVCVIHSTI